MFLHNILVPPPSPGVRKYVLWCLLCGGAAGLLGIMFLAVYFLIRNYTSSVAYFETVPTFVPSTLVSSVQWLDRRREFIVCGDSLPTSSVEIRTVLYMHQKLTVVLEKMEDAKGV